MRTGGEERERDSSPHCSLICRRPDLICTILYSEVEMDKMHVNDHRKTGCISR